MPRHLLCMQDCLTYWRSWGMLLQCNDAWHSVTPAAEPEGVFLVSARERVAAHHSVPWGQASCSDRPCGCRACPGMDTCVSLMLRVSWRCAGGFPTHFWLLANW